MSKQDSGDGIQEGRTREGKTDSTLNAHPATRAPSALHLFEGFGVELEYMIVDAGTLNVKPLADELLRDAAGTLEYVSDFEQDNISWSNELALHVVELKTTGPVSSLVGLSPLFQREIDRVNRLLDSRGARLMPSGMHPWMHPDCETRLWPHENSPIYEAFNKVFDCRGHGWGNLQSVHLNLPFADDAEFARLHAAIRLLLPIMPALSASSPIIDGRQTGMLDTRLNVYRDNTRRIRLVTAGMIPEPVFSKTDYEREILQPMYAEIAPFDPAGVLQHEWLNARGAIARFMRNTIEIRVLDVQECPVADVAICAMIVEVLRALCNERWSHHETQQRYPNEPLEALFIETLRAGERAIVDDATYHAMFGFTPDSNPTAGDLWRHLYETTGSISESFSAEYSDAANSILSEGPLARRILSRLGNDPVPSQIEAVYRELCDCLANGRMLHGMSIQD